MDEKDRADTSSHIVHQEPNTIQDSNWIQRNQTQPPSNHFSQVPSQSQSPSQPNDQLQAMLQQIMARQEQMYKELKNDIDYIRKSSPQSLNLFLNKFDSFILLLLPNLILPMQITLHSEVGKNSKNLLPLPSLKKILLPFLYHPFLNLLILNRQTPKIKLRFPSRKL